MSLSQRYSFCKTLFSLIFVNKNCYESKKKYVIKVERSSGIS